MSGILIAKSLAVAAILVGLFVVRVIRYKAKWSKLAASPELLPTQLPKEK